MGENTVIHFVASCYVSSIYVAEKYNLPAILYDEGFTIYRVDGSSGSKKKTLPCECVSNISDKMRYDNNIVAISGFYAEISIYCEFRMLKVARAFAEIERRIEGRDAWEIRLFIQNCNH